MNAEISSLIGFAVSIQTPPESRTRQCLASDCTIIHKCASALAKIWRRAGLSRKPPVWPLIFAVILFGLVCPHGTLAQSDVSSQAGYSNPPMPLSKGQTATLLPNGTWLLIGGRKNKAIRGDLVFVASDRRQKLTLPQKLQIPRADHSATLLPDGTVLILGGVDKNGHVVSTAERFDPRTTSIQSLPGLGLIPRMRHTATLLTDERLLVAGGLSGQGDVLTQAELWNVRTHHIDPSSLDLVIPRYGHTARLLPSGKVLLKGGQDRSHQAVGIEETYDPGQERWLTTDVLSSESPPALHALSNSPKVEQSIPEYGTTDAAVDAVLALRFSTPLLVTSLDQDSVTLVGPEGQVPCRIVPAEEGMLLFVTPQRQLFPQSQYTLFVNGGRDIARHPLPFTAITFKTAVLNTPAAKAQNAEEKALHQQDEWHPGLTNMKGDWRIKLGDLQMKNLPPLSAAPNVTALSGQVLSVRGKALSGVSLKLGPQTATTDANGQFLLRNVPAGTQVLVIDGNSTRDRAKLYGRYEVQVKLAGRQTTVLPYTIWLTHLDNQSATPISSPTTAETVLTSARIPGLELRIPPGIVIRDSEGKIVTEASITAIPIDRPPFPLPNHDVPVYFTIQPGGASLQSLNPAGAKGARLVYPNFSNNPPGSRIDFWNYDARDKGWYVYGQGTVSADAKQIIPDPDVIIYGFTGAMVASPSNAPPEGPPPGNCAQGGDPVDCFTGLFIESAIDLEVADVIPIKLSRTYRTRDTRSRAFGIGANHGYDFFLVGDIFPYTYQELILPDGGRIHYDRVSSGTYFYDAVYTHTSTPTRFYGSTIRWKNDGWELLLKDGTRYNFGDSMASTNPSTAAVRQIHDRFGNALTLTRNGYHDLTKIVSSHGRWISLSYDANRHITQASDNAGRTVHYAYDTSGRLSSVTDANGNVTQYSYDALHRILTVQDPRHNTKVTNSYDDNGRVQSQTYADGSIVSFTYTLDVNGKVTRTDETDARGMIWRWEFNPAGYTTSRTRALGRPEERTTTYQVQDGTNLVLSQTDALGRKTAYTYDTVGNVTSVTRLADTPSAITTTFGYEPQFNQVTRITDPLNHTTRFEYGPTGDLISITDPLDHQFTIVNDLLGRPVSFTDALGHSTKITYDGGDLNTIEDPLQQQMRFLIDAVGRVRSVTDALGNIKVHDYDALNHLVRYTDPLNNQVNYSYDANSNLLSYSDPLGHSTQQTFDSRNRLTSRTDALGQTENYGYDTNGNLIRHTDRKGQVTGYNLRWPRSADEHRLRRNAGQSDRIYEHGELHLRRGRQDHPNYGFRQRRYHSDLRRLRPTPQ